MIEVVLDFETYYNKKDKYTLSAKGMTYEKYIRDPRFEIIGVAIKIDGGQSEFYPPHQVREVLDYIGNTYGWDNVRLIAHNGRFDCAILGWIFNVYPKQVADTMLMSRACQMWDGHSLDNVTKQLQEKFSWGAWYDDGKLKCGTFKAGDDILNKGDEVIKADGFHLADFTDEEYDAYGAYACTDVDLTYSAYRYFMDVRKFPEKEIDVMTLTIEMYTYPVIELHKPVLEYVSELVNGQRQALLDKVGLTQEDLRSDNKFAELLRNLGVEPPMKTNAKGELKYAFAKKDLQFLKLLEHENEDVVDLVKARLGNKSSQAVTRVKSLLDMADRGLLPIPLEYYAAHTGRWGGCLTADTLVLCLTAEQQVVEKRIVDVLLSDLVWDGLEFVEHEGVKFNGYQEVITYDGITGTKCHPVFINDKETVSLFEAMRTKTPIMDCPKPKVK